MSASRHWYVQTTFGVLLGPMPDDALKEMQRTGALAPQDLVRRGDDGDWMRAVQLPGYSATSRVDATHHTNPNTTQSLSEDRVGEVSVEPKSGTTNRQDEAPAGLVLKSNINPPRGSAGASPSRIPARRATFQNSLARRNERHRPRAMIAALLVLALVTGWWFWPRADRHFCNRLLAIRAELIERRSKSNAQEARDLKMFAAKAMAELDARIPALEMKAKTGHQESMYLLRASRDCLKPLLADASETQKPLEENLDYFLWALKNYYDGYQPLETLPAQVTP